MEQPLWLPEDLLLLLRISVPGKPIFIQFIPGRPHHRVIFLLSLNHHRVIFLLNLDLWDGFFKHSLFVSHHVSAKEGEMWSYLSHVTPSFGWNVVWNKSRLFKNPIPGNNRSSLRSPKSSALGTSSVKKSTLSAQPSSSSYLLLLVGEKAASMSLCSSISSARSAKSWAMFGFLQGWGRYFWNVSKMQIKIHERLYLLYLSDT